MVEEKSFDKYQKRGSLHWQEMTSRDIRKFNAFQQGRYDWLIRTAGDLQGKQVLDLGCGDGALSYLLAREGACVTGVDNEELGLKFARENLQKIDPGKRLRCQFVSASAYQLPFPGENFDLVFLCEVIEHLAEPVKMLAEARRVLKQGGKFLLTTPYRLREFPADPNHVREYFPQEIKAMLAKYFSQVEIRLTHHVFWYGLYTYAFRHFRNRQFGKWLINALTLWFGFNPFLIAYEKPTKQDVFTQILGIAKKPE